MDSVGTAKDREKRWRSDNAAEADEKRRTGHVI